MTDDYGARVKAALGRPQTSCRHCHGGNVQWREWNPTPSMRHALWWCSDCERPAHIGLRPGEVGP